MVLLLPEGTETKDATQTREKRTNNQPTPVFVEDSHETSFETFICLAIYKTSGCSQASYSSNSSFL